VIDFKGETAREDRTKKVAPKRFRKNNTLAIRNILVRTKSLLGHRIFVNRAILHNDLKIFARVFDELDIFQGIAIDEQ